MKYVKWTALSGVILCGLCCLLPLISITLGLGALGSIIGNLEKVGVGLLVLAAILFAWHLFRKLKGRNNCGKNCSCQTGSKEACN